MKFNLTIDPKKPEEVRVTAHQRSSLTDQIENLVLQYAGKDRLPAYTEDGMKMLLFEDIECITVTEGKTFAIDTQNKKYRLKHRLYELEKVLPGCFIRINKSTLANEKRLDRFSAAFNGAVNAVFKCGYTEYVSRRCFAEIKRRYDE
ncbi:MAG: LytTR family transcriptional regulator [Clostridiales bacterium]|nr:LytTR family transcriptional regulator [Clostridiales bacterium]